MKKFLFSLFLLFSFSSLVYADTIYNVEVNDKAEITRINETSVQNLVVYKYNSSLEEISCNTITDCYNKAIQKYNQESYQYYTISINISSNIIMNLVLFNDVSNYYQLTNTNYLFFSDSENFATRFDYLSIYLNTNNYSNYMVYDYNYNFIFDGNFVFQGFYENESQDNYNNMLQVKTGETAPKIKDLLNYNSWSEYYQNQLSGYTEVNLDNYDYVLLSLKNYNLTDSFQTNLQVKGQVGITPIYNYGQTSKDSVTGSQVQDRCNINYDSYTSYPFYILQSDLQNNAIYAVKECSSGSSFKFDNTIFDITYITSQESSNPTITINGNTYDVIPYDDLPSTATKNEEDNYIPGQSGSATDLGGLDSAVKSSQNTLSQMWNTFTYFTDFVGQLFSALPPELHAILLTAFTVSVVIGLIKLFTS